MKRKGYAIVTLTIQREVEIELDDEKSLTLEEQEALVQPIVEEKFGKFGDNDELEIEELDYAD